MPPLNATCTWCRTVPHVRSWSPSGFILALRSYVDFVESRDFAPLPMAVCCPHDSVRRSFTRNAHESLCVAAVNASAKRRAVPSTTTDAVLYCVTQCRIINELSSSTLSYSDDDNLRCRASVEQPVSPVSIEFSVMFLWLSNMRESKPKQTLSDACLSVINTHHQAPVVLGDTVATSLLAVFRYCAIA